MAKQAVLLLAHGTPETIEQIPEYLRNVVSGRPLPLAVIQEIQHRYSLIGRSPLTEITFKQGSLVQAELAAKDAKTRVYVGMRNWRPYITDVVRQMRADGVEEAAVICMAPHNSRTSVGLYRRAVEAEAAGMRIDFTEGWAHHPLLIEAFAERLRPRLAALTAELGHAVPVLFTAHSVPSRTIQVSEGQGPGASDGQTNQAQPDKGQPRLWPGAANVADPYAEEARGTAAQVAERVPEIPKWWFAFQSQGASGGPWIGPSVETTLEAIAAEGIKTVILQPIGFLCDHVEILFDVDILFRDYAAKLGVRLERPESLNVSPTLASAVADLARNGLRRLQQVSGTLQGGRETRQQKS
jgi:protoporphyrin/coproporphyrin ferrochelatase